MVGKETVGRVPFWVYLPIPTHNIKKMLMNPIPSPSTLKCLRSTQSTRNVHQNEETEPNAKNKTENIFAVSVSSHIQRVNTAGC